MALERWCTHEFTGKQFLVVVKAFYVVDFSLVMRKRRKENHMGIGIETED